MTKKFTVGIGGVLFVSLSILCLVGMLEGGDTCVFENLVKEMDLSDNEEQPKQQRISPVG